jgi:hypothetical protein
MTHDEFSIGLEFWFCAKRWRCTDIGTRVIVAISLEPHEVVYVRKDRTDRTKKTEIREVTNDPSWLNGPPYAILESVLDEYDIEACSLTPEK